MKKEFKLCINHQFLNFPVKNNAPKVRIRIFSSKGVCHFFDIEWAEEEVDFWVFKDVTDYKDQELVFEITKAEEKTTTGINGSSITNLEKLLPIVHSDKIKSVSGFYEEPNRPQFHFTAKCGWLNDPNGLFFYKGIYHLFYQHNPYGRTWGNMHWGHAISKNLVQWKELSEVLHPDEMGTIFSGSGVVDWNNSSELQNGEDPPIICLYTAAGEYADIKSSSTQCLMYSQNGGHSWNKYENNPVIPAIASGSRDPAVIWHPVTRHWIMALYIGKKKFKKKNVKYDQHFAIFKSKNLKSWEKVQDLFFPGMGECGEVFPLHLDQDIDQIMWVFWTADGHHLIGNFDGNEFIPRTEMLKSTYSAVYLRQTSGVNFNGGYAAQTWNDIPPEDGRRIQIAWLAGDIPNVPFNQQMTFPVELKLISTDAGPRIYSWPIREIELLYKETSVLHNINASHNPVALPTGNHKLLDITFEIEIADKSDLVIDLRGILLNYDSHQMKLFCHDRAAKLWHNAGKMHLRVLLDKASIEIFAEHGLTYIPISVVPDEGNVGCYVYVKKGHATIKKIIIAKLNSSWL